MISEKKFKLEINNRNNIIGQLRKDRISILIKYQKLNSDFIDIFQSLEEFSNQQNNILLKEQISKLKEKFKNYFV